MVSKETKKAMQELFDMLKINEVVNETAECLEEVAKIILSGEQDGVGIYHSANNMGHLQELDHLK